MMADNKLQKKSKTVYKKLAAKYPDADIELDYSNPLELLVATMLSAQCTDKKVNQVTKELFAKYKRPEDYLEVPPEELEQDIRPTGFYRQKTKSLRGVMQALVDDYDGCVPEDLASMTALPGIGRKTANVILGNAFGVPGIAVDTHVKRVANRIGLTTNSNPDKIEKDLMRLYPEAEWVNLSHVLIFHGRYTCKSRKPMCEECPVTEHCNFFAEQVRE